MERGDVIANRYRLERKIYSGGMGVVWEARHTMTGGRLALKLLREADSGRDDHEASTWPSRFRREARATCSLNSPHVVQIFDAAVDTDTGLSYIAMELLEGEDVGELIRRVGPLSPDAALRIVAQAGEGIRAAHEVGIIHRDVKPSNLFVENTDADNHRVKVLDFGIAKVVNQSRAFCSAADLTQTGNLLGTPSYMSPEQARGLKDIDFRADVWSLGAVLYATLTGAAPYVVTEGGLGQLILVLCTQDPPPVQDRAPWVEPSVAAIVHRALSRDIHRRYASVQQMLEDIYRELPQGAHLRGPMLSSLSPQLRSHIAVRWDPCSDEVPTLDIRPNSVDRALEPTPVSTHSAPQTPRSRRWMWAAAAPVLGAIIGLTSWTLLSHPTPAPEPVAQSPVLSSSVPDAPASSAPLTAVLRILPPTSQVWIDGAPAVVADGGVLLKGRPGQAFDVRVSSEGVERQQAVALTEIGPVPSTLRVETPPRSSVAKPVSPRPVAKPPAEGVGIVTTFQ